MEIFLRRNWKRLGYGVILIIVGFFRELLGSGTLLGYPVLGNPIQKKQDYMHMDMKITDLCYYHQWH